MKKGNLIFIEMLLIILLLVSIGIAVKYYENMDKKETITNTTLENTTQPTGVIAQEHNYIQSPHNTIDWVYRYSTDEVVIKEVSTLEVDSINGYSMQPTMFTHNKVILRTYKNKDELKEGQIIWFKYNNKDIIHRIQGLYPDYVATRGDNTNSGEKIKYENIQYIVIGVLYT